VKNFIYNFYSKKELKKAEKTVKKINEFYNKNKHMSDKAISNMFTDIKLNVLTGKASGNFTAHRKYETELLGLIKIASERVLNMNPYDVQLIGAIILDKGKIAEMKTGEGKSLTAAVAALYNSVYDETVHIVTVNDYLAKRDADFFKPLYNFFGIDSGVIYSNQDIYEKKNEYKKAIVYATNSELGFDYLRDNTVTSKSEKTFDRMRYFTIIDEVDSILIDEARTPLIISQKMLTEHDREEYEKADKLAKMMKEGEDYEINLKEKNVMITEEGLKKAEEFIGIDNLYGETKGIRFAHRLNNAIYANKILKKDKDYTIIKNKETGEDEIVLIDEFTGRLSIGKSLSDGLHQAIETKEGVKITPENKTIAKITYPNLFSIYKKVAGMTGTALTQREEFLKVYGLEVIPVPTNRPVAREDLNDLIYGEKSVRDKKVIEKIKELNKKGRPVLVGTTSVEASERISALLKKEGIKHNVLNAKNHEREAEIIAEAGKKGAVTVSTNMAGRGTDIKLDDETRKLGGLYVIGVERNENRRIDDQLRGRSGRQGDPGTSRFYLSLDDKLLKVFSNSKSIERLRKTMKGEEIPIESSFVTRAIKKAQQNIESLNTQIRKNLLKYDNVLDKQRKLYYQIRDEIMEIENPEIFKEKIFNYFKETYQNGQREIDETSIEKIKNIEKKLKENLDFIFGEPQIDKNLFFKTMFLRIFDEEFLNFLDALDVVKEGIYLRGMAQKDPLVEYTKESNILFENLIKETKRRIVEEMSELDIEAVKENLQRHMDNYSFDKGDNELIGASIDDILRENDGIPTSVFSENPLAKIKKPIKIKF
jgi:preprotein translocase subunit SecA